MAKKLKVKKKPLVVLIIFFIGIIGLIFGIKAYKEYLYHQTTEYKLLKTGYSKDEISLFTKNMSSEELNNLIDKPKNNELLPLIKEKYFIKDNLNRYLEYKANNKDKSYTDIVALVNVNIDYGWYEHDLDADISNEYGMLVNKFYKLNENYSPEDIVKISNWYAYEGHSIREAVLDAYMEMWNAANAIGLKLIVSSSYRDFAIQKETYDSYDTYYGREYADAIAARPGYSEHQTGLALDILKLNTKKDEFETTEEYAWLLENAHKFGFILRYPKDKEYITGYTFESWHYRYLGKDLATKVYEEGITYDEYYAYYIAK